MESVTVLVVGDAGTGKRSLVEVINPNGSFLHKSYVIKKYSGLEVFLEINHIAGLEDQDDLRQQYYQALCGVHVVMLCFSVVDPCASNNVHMKWLPEIKINFPEVSLLIVGTKKDLRTDTKLIGRLVSSHLPIISCGTWIQYAEDVGAREYLECSNRSLYTIKRVFERAAGWGLRYKHNRTSL